MAEVVLGLAASHTPMLTIAGDEWEFRAQADRDNDKLNLSDGRFVSYAQLVEEVGEPYRDIATPENFKAAAARCEAHLDKMADELTAAEVDVALVIGDDQGELFPLSNTPMISVYYGEEIATNDVWGRDDKPEWMNRMAVGYRMDKVHRFPAAPDLAHDLIDGLVAQEVDIAAASKVDDPVTAGFGHAFGFIAERLFKGKSIPMLPVLLNTYFPPNVMRSSRAFALGDMIRTALRESEADLRVAVIASGGLSHFVVDEELDRQVLAGIEPGRSELLTRIQPCALQSGSSEILNWIMTAGAVDHLELAWTEYEPVRRTPAGTGTGIAFAAWHPA